MEKNLTKKSNIYKRSDVGTLFHFVLAAFFPIGWFINSRYNDFLKNEKFLYFFNIPQNLIASKTYLFIAAFFEAVLWGVLIVVGSILISYLVIFFLKISKASFYFALPPEAQIFSIVALIIVYKKLIYKSQKFIFSDFGTFLFIIFLTSLILEHYFFLFSKNLSNNTYKAISFNSIPIFWYFFIIIKLNKSTIQKIVPPLNIEILKSAVSLFVLHFLYATNPIKSTLGILSVTSGLLYFNQLIDGYKNLIFSIKNENQISWQVLISSFTSLILSTIIVFGMIFKATILNTSGAFIINVQENRKLYQIEQSKINTTEEWKALTLFEKEKLREDDLLTLFFSFKNFISVSAGNFECSKNIYFAASLEALFAYIINILVVSYGISIFISRKQQLEI